MRGRKTLLKNINRRRSCQVQHQGGASVEMVKYETESEVQKLIREKDLMMQEFVHLRQEHDTTLQQIDALKQRMQSAESRQKQMVSFLARVLQSPAFLNHLKKLKEQREIGSVRVRRKFLKQQQQPTQSESDKPMDQKILKRRLDSSVSQLPVHEHGESSASPLVVCDRDETGTLPVHLLQDLVDRIDIDIGGQDSFIGSSKSEDLEGNNLMSFQADSTGYFISFPDDIAPEPIVSDDNPPACEDIVRPETDAFKGKNVMNSETDAAASGTEYLTAFPCDVPQEEMFQDWSAPETDFANEEAFWNVGADVGESLISSGPEVWGDLGAFDAQELQAAGSCSLWGLGLHNLEEDLDVEKYVCDESSFQEHKDDHRQLNEDSPRKLEP